MGKLIAVILRSNWDRATAIGLAVASVIALVAGWLGVASTSYPAEQVPYIISGGLLGIVLVALSATLWLSADLRDEWRKLDELSEQLGTTDRVTGPVTTTAAVTEGQSSSGSRSAVSTGAKHLV